MEDRLRVDGPGRPNTSGRETVDKTQRTDDTAPTLPAVLLLLWGAITMLLWAMAFYRAPDTTPEWLLRAQSVCFGTNENGLPDTYGWMVLAMGPLSFLAGLLVALGREVQQGCAAMAGSVGGRVLLVVALATLVGETVWIKGRIDAGIAVDSAVYAFEKPENLPSDYPRTHREAAAFSLVDQHGAQISPTVLRGKVVFLTFAFAHCETVCPAILENLLAAAENLPEDKIKALVVTLDPWRDTPRTLPALAGHWNLGENAHVLSGPVDEVVAVLDSYGVPRKRDEKTGDMAHPALVYLLDQDGAIAYSFNNPNADWLTAAARRLLEEPHFAVSDKP
jgi:protein SCO1